MDSLRSHVSLISHPYSDLLAPYLGTAILTILCFQQYRTIIILSTNRSYVILPCVTNRQLIKA